MSPPIMHRLVLALLCTAWMAAARCAEPGTISQVALCEDENEWPPYIYFERVGGQRSKRLKGYTVDVIDEILRRHHIAYHIDMLPWQRCLAVSEIGREYQLLLNMTWSEERARHYLYSRPYYATANYYYYSLRRHPQGLPIHSPADLHRFRACGIRGYNYSGFGLAPREVDQGAGDFPALIAKLHLGRCDLFVERHEVMQGYRAIGKASGVAPGVMGAPVPGMEPGQFHMAVSRRAPQAQALLDLIDAELAKMEESGRLRALLRKATQELEP